MPTSRALAAVVLAALVAAPVLADDAADGVEFVRLGRLHVGDGTVEHNVVVAIDDGRFVSVGRDAPPAGANVRDLSQHVGCPGFIDAVTQLGLDGGAAETSEALTPDVRAADAFDGHSKDLAAATAAGTTCVGLSPSPSNVAAGRGAVAVQGADGRWELLERNGPPVFAFVPPALSAGRVPSTVAGARALLGAAFEGRRWRTPGESDPPVRDAALDMLAALRDGPALVHADSAAAARVAVETIGGRGLTPTLVGLRRGHIDPVALAALETPCIITALDPEDSVALLELPGRLARAGVDVTLSSGSPARHPNSLRLAMALAVARGLPTSHAVPAVTGRAARALGVADRIGRVAEGLRADLVVFDGEPWEPSTRIVLVVAGGRIVCAPSETDR